MVLLISLFLPQILLTAGRPFGLRSNLIFGRGSGFIALDEVNCTGTESDILSCRASERGNHDCSPDEDAGVLCPCKKLIIVSLIIIGHIVGNFRGWAIL